MIKLTKRNILMVHQDLENVLWSWTTPKRITRDEILDIIGDEDDDIIGNLESDGHAWADCSEWEDGIYVFATDMDSLTNTMEEVQCTFS